MTSAGGIHANDFISSHLREAVKQFIEYDEHNRMVRTYTAVSDADVGDQCTMTEYAYSGTSTRIIKMRESLAVWQPGWDI